MTMIQKNVGTLCMIALCAVGVSVYGYYMYNKPVEGLEFKKADYNLSPLELVKEFQNDEETANLKFLNKVIKVTGMIASIEEEHITLEVEGAFAQVICEMKLASALKNLSKGQEITIKGLCTGYLMDVVLVNCNISKQP